MNRCKICVQVYFQLTGLVIVLLHCTVAASSFNSSIIHAVYNKLISPRPEFT